MRNKKNILGFTLIELMITVAIIGVLATLAYPAYTGYLIRSRRAVAQGDLANAASAMERWFTTRGNYSTATIGDATADTFRRASPSDGPDAARQYTLSFTVAGVNGASNPNPNAATFRIRATPLAGTLQATNGYMEINQLGAKFWDRNNDGDVADANENNWNR